MVNRLFGDSASRTLWVKGPVTPTIYSTVAIAWTKRRGHSHFAIGPTIVIAMPEVVPPIVHAIAIVK